MNLNRRETTAKLQKTTRLQKVDCFLVVQVIYPFLAVD
jgi:hypothetical protein